MIRRLVLLVALLLLLLLAGAAAADPKHVDGGWQRSDEAPLPTPTAPPPDGTPAPTAAPPDGAEEQAEPTGGTVWFTLLCLFVAGLFVLILRALRRRGSR